MLTTRLFFGWEGRSPTSEAIEMAGLISAELPANARLTVTPDVDGGAVLRWIHGACRVDFFCDNEGELTLLTVGADGSPRGIEFGAQPDIKSAVACATRFLEDATAR